MTTAPDGESAAHPPRRRWRWVRRLVALVALVIGLFLALHLPVVQQRLRPALQRAASAAIGGTITVTSLQFSLWTGRVHATGLHVSRPGLDVTSASLDVQVRRGRGSVVRVTEPRVVVSLAPEAPPALLNQRPWTALDRFAAIDIVRGALRVQRDDGSDMLKIEGLEAHATRRVGGLAGTVAASSIAVSRPGNGWQEAADARLDIELPDATHAIHICSGHLTVGQSLVQVTGDLQQTTPAACARVPSTRLSATPATASPTRDAA